LFFFSSRRRHTRCLSDWSSDVCSSDLRSMSSISTTSSPIDLSQAGEVFVNLSVEELVDHAVRYDDGVIAANEALVCRSGKFTGRSEERRVGKEGGCRWWAGR